MNWNIYVLLHFRCYKFHTKILTFWLNFRYLSDILSLICLSSNPLTIYVFENSIFKWIVLRPNQKFRSEKISAKMVEWPNFFPADFFSAEIFSVENHKSCPKFFPPKFFRRNFFRRSFWGLMYPFYTKKHIGSLYKYYFHSSLLFSENALISAVTLFTQISVLTYLRKIGSKFH